MADTPSRSSALRLFLGLWPDDAVRAALLENASAWDWPATARRTRPERLHVTLHFIGNVQAERMTELRRSLRVESEGGELVLDRPAVWRGGIAVLEATQVPASLRALHADLAQRLRDLGLPVEERPWRPHVTFARKASGAQPRLAAQPVRWPVGPAYVLVQSLPGGRGYEPLVSFG